MHTGMQQIWSWHQIMGMKHCTGTVTFFFFFTLIHFSNNQFNYYHLWGKGYVWPGYPCPGLTVKENKCFTVLVLFVVCKISTVRILFFNQDILYFNLTKQNSNIHCSLRIQECGRFEFDTRYGKDWVHQNLGPIVRDWGRNLVQMCKPLTWLIRGTRSFLIRKNTGTVENWFQIKLEYKFMLLVIKARFSQEQFTRLIMWLNAPLFLSTTFWTIKYS